MSNRNQRPFVGQPTYQPYQENVYTSSSAPFSDHGFALPPTPVQPAYGEFYSNRISELSHESHPQIYSAPPLESPVSHSGPNSVHLTSYPLEGYGVPSEQNYPPDFDPNQGQDSYSLTGYNGQEYAESGYAPETGYADRGYVHTGQPSYPGQFEAVPYHIPPEAPNQTVSHQNQHPQQVQNPEVVEEKPLIEF